MNVAADSTERHAERIRRVQELENVILGISALQDAPHADVLPGPTTRQRLLR